VGRVLFNIVLYYKKVIVDIYLVTSLGYFDNKLSYGYFNIELDNIC
jgi:hypothetical protein